MTGEDSPFAQCPLLVLSAPTIDHILTPKGSICRLGGPGLHTSWLAKPMQARIHTSGPIAPAHAGTYAEAVYRLGGLFHPLDAPHTAIVELDYTSTPRKARFLQPPPAIQPPALERMIRLSSPRIVIVNPVHGEIPPDTAAALPSQLQDTAWTALDVQGYTRTCSLARLLWKMDIMHTQYDVIHVSDDDLPEDHPLLPELAAHTRLGVVYTKAAEEAILYDPAGRPRYRITPPEPAGSPAPGGGDVLLAAYMLFLCATWNPAKSLLEAVKAATYYVSKKPGQTPCPLGRQAP